ncbi:MAG: hypothetical protein KME03_13840 [Aphanocapsa lilacina HA4352-LM1]|jgi:hypothetical protein|uniref:Gsl2332 protein n=2 Tax=Gloeobacter TaxID=33071 RepID=Q7NI52_GLOVI|nr:MULTISPECIES: DUF6679 family protein [Gloeobacter]MBW4698952.1 hypothetical protein [Aphanocapsa lilacina HA4352-LM1]UFP94492.1 hypothetical protein ISF26_22585 [Gloeobacter morelensis MG652769]BAC90273.1 gsl2332 [Gloeobacter violaceus PCC 7421]
MLHRKLYQICQDKLDVCLFLRDQGRWLEQVRILDIEGDVVTVRYTTDDEDEIASWEEIIRIDNIGSVTRKLSTLSKRHDSAMLIAEDCPESER